MAFWKRLSRHKLLLFLAVAGPGLITANVDNDANGIATYSVAGATFGYNLIWVLFLAAFFQAFIQEMCSRMGCVTGKGLSDLVRENFGARTAFWLMVVLFLANLGNTVGDAAGLAAAGELFGISKYLCLPLVALATWYVVVKGSFKKLEKIFLFVCSIYITYVISGVIARPSWSEVRNSVLAPHIRFDPQYMILVVAVIGTTIAPWMQFFQQSMVRDKEIRASDYACARWDTYLGTGMMALVSFFIIVSCAVTLHVRGIHVETASEAALALEPIAGRYCKILFAIGLLNAAIFSIPIIALSTSYTICECFGWESGMGQPLEEAPVFYGIFAFMLIVSAGIILIPGAPLIPIMVLSQALNGALLPIILIFILILVNNRNLMGEYVNTPLYNVFSWLSVIAVSAAAIALLFSPLWQK